MNVVVRYFPILKQYGICHANSYQNAFASKINNFTTREEAIEFAKAMGCNVEHHDFDQLQAN